MRGKVRGRQYGTWQELVRDFELIISNALKYNLKRSRVLKAVRAPLLLAVVCAAAALLGVTAAAAAAG